MKCGIIFAVVIIQKFLITKCQQSSERYENSSSDEDESNYVSQKAGGNKEVETYSPPGASNEQSEEIDPNSKEHGDFYPQQKSYPVSVEDRLNYKTSTEQGSSLEIDPHYEKEKAAGTVFLGVNAHHSYPTEYKDFGRRFVPQYPYVEVKQVKEIKETVAEKKLHDVALKGYKNNLKADYRHMMPQKASPEMVLKIAKGSALLEASKPVNPTEELIQKEILRTGDYWDRVTVEVVDPTKILRSQVDQESSNLVEAEIEPGTKLYQLVSALRKLSPKFLYVIYDKAKRK